MLAKIVKCHNPIGHNCHNCTDNFQTIFHDFCTAFVCVRKISKKYRKVCLYAKKRNGSTDFEALVLLFDFKIN
jgi:hypothetical protein